jgi:hypothetical protein
MILQAKISRPRQRDIALHELTFGRGNQEIQHGFGYGRSTRVFPKGGAEHPRHVQTYNGTSLGF